MKDKIYSIIVLIFSFIIFICFYQSEVNYEEYKIIDVVEADKFYLDFNNNNQKDDGELVKLIDINAFTPKKNKTSKTRAQNLELNEFDMLKNGYLARSWAKEELSGKTVQITAIHKTPTTVNVKINYNNEDLGKTLLIKGLATTKSNCKTYNYFQYQNFKQIEENIKEISNLDFKILNLKSKIIHNLDCEYAQSISNGEIILKNEANFKYCNFCKNPQPKITSKYSKNTNKYPKSIMKKFGNITLFLINPYEHKKPNAKSDTLISKTIIQEITLAKNSIDIALYGIGEQDEIINALRKAKQRGVKIRTVIDLDKNGENIYENSIDFIKEFNSKTDKTDILMHNKFFIFDNQKVLTGSTNLSSTGTGGYNSNSMVLINSKELAQFYTKEFEQMYNGKFSNAKNKIETKEINIGDFKITPHFLPDTNIFNNVISKELNNAKESVYVSIFYLTERNLLHQLIELKNKGVEVLVLIDALGSKNFKERIDLLKAKGIYVKTENWGGKNHEKTIIIDNKTVILGSANFSKSGFYKNDENILVIKNSAFANFYKDYFLYLFNKLDDKYLHFIPNAEGLDSINSCYDGIDNDYDNKPDFQDPNCGAKH